MRKGAVVTLLGAFLLVGASAGNAGASDLFESNLAGKQVAFQEIAGISPDVAQPWVVAGGEVEIGDDGGLKLDVTGLLLLDGTVGPIRSVFASLVCQKTVASADPTNEVVASTADVPLSAAGDAESEDTITLPDVCVAPIVLVRVGLVDSPNCADFGQPTPCDVTVFGIPSPWIAASGF